MRRRRGHRARLLALLCGLGLLMPSAQALAGDPAPRTTPASSATLPVVLLHGLARSARSMAGLAEHLEAAGYAVCNIGYPSREAPIATLVEAHLRPALRACPGVWQGAHYVTHSMGGILLRALAQSEEAPRIHRVVMLAPPNQGSEVVDAIGDWPAFGWWNGPAGRELGTGAHSLPQRLGPVPFELGVIAATRSYNPLLSALIPGDDDGKVAVASTRVAGMTDHATVAASHTFVMNHARARELTLRFLREGRFDAAGNASAAADAGADPLD